VVASCRTRLAADDTLHHREGWFTVVAQHQRGRSDVSASQPVSVDELVTHKGLGRLRGLAGSDTDVRWLN